MCRFTKFPGDLNILLEVQVGSIKHHRCISEVKGPQYLTFARMIQVQRDRNRDALCGNSPNVSHVLQTQARVAAACIQRSAVAYLNDHWGTLLLSRLYNRLNLLKRVGIERANGKMIAF